MYNLKRYVTDPTQFFKIYEMTKGGQMVKFLIINYNLVKIIIRNP